MQKSNRLPAMRIFTQEKWKDIPGLEGYAQISNLGLVKRLSYEAVYKNGAVYYKEEKIIKPTVIRSRNKFKGDYTRHYACRVTVNGIRHNFMPARLVYYLFVQRFDLNDSNMVVHAKNGNNLDIFPDNLVLETKSEKTRRMIERKRFYSPFNNLSELDRRRVSTTRAMRLAKIVSQYNKQGQLKKTFASISSAAKKTGIHATAIAAVLKGKIITAGSFYWREGNAPSIDIDKMLRARKSSFRLQHGNPVTQYAMSGVRVKTFPSVWHASQDTAISPSCIHAVMRGAQKSAGGYYWQRGEGPAIINLYKYRYGRMSRAIMQTKPVMQIRSDGTVLARFASLKAAAASVGIPSSYISAACTGRQRTAGGFRWKLAHRNAKNKR